MEDDDGFTDAQGDSGRRRPSMFSDNLGAPQRKSLFGSLVNALVGFGRTRMSFACEPDHHSKDSKSKIAQHEPTYR